MLFLVVLVWSRISQPWDDEAQHHDSLRDVLTSLEGVSSHVSETVSVWLLVPYIRSILDVYMSVYHTLLSKPIQVNI